MYNFGTKIEGQILLKSENRKVIWLVLGLLKTEGRSVLRGIAVINDEITNL